MKRLIGPILIGLVMFGAAFGGAFFLYRHQQAKAAEHVKEVIASTREALKAEGRVAAFSGRFVAMAPPGPETGAAAPDQTAKPALIVPGSVRYDVDLKALKEKDVVWHEREGLLSVKLPALLLDGPDLDIEDMKRIGEDRAWTAPANGSKLLNDVARKAVQAELLKQAQGGKAMTLARDAAKALVERAFATQLRAQAVQASIEVHFADEPAEGQEDGEEAAATEGHDAASAPGGEAAPGSDVSGTGNAMDHHEGGNASAASQEE